MTIKVIAMSEALTTHSIPSDLIRFAMRVAKQSHPNEVPVGAVVILPGDGKNFVGVNTRQNNNDIAGHAEINALRAASNTVGSWRLQGATLVSTLEPCPMCAYAIAESGVSKLIFGAYDPKVGSAGSALDLLRGWPTLRSVEVHGGVMEEECRAQLQNFFSKLRSSTR